jgi:hypothetical protein
VTAPSGPSQSLAPQICSPLSVPEQKITKGYYCTGTRGKKLPISNSEDKEPENTTKLNLRNKTLEREKHENFRGIQYFNHFLSRFFSFLLDRTNTDRVT